MMDLLVQVATANKIPPSGHILQPYGESGLLPYKPSTPIGTLDTWTVHIVPKNQATQNPANKIGLKQVVPPFEQTFRFQVNLPRNQLYVTRVSGRTNMKEVLEQACREKDLDPTKYSLRHPRRLDEVLHEELSLAEYGHNQVNLVSKKTLLNTVSSEDILVMQQLRAKSCGSSSRSLSPDSSVSPPQPPQPSRPLRKRRPAPKPPTPASSQPQHKPLSQKRETSNGQIICHSRTSSDSSGYHEASVLSESPDSNNSLPDSLPRRSKLPGGGGQSQLSRSLSNLNATTSAKPSKGMKAAQSTSSLSALPGRKKKPAPPPPVAIAEEPTKEEQTPLKAATLPPGAKLSENEPPAKTITSVHPVEVRSVYDRLEEVVEKSQPSKETADDESDSKDSLIMPDEEIDRIFNNATKDHVSLESGVDCEEGPHVSLTYLPSPPDPPDAEPLPDWEYKLPAPPTFRDDNPPSPIHTEYDTITVTPKIFESSEEPSKTKEEKVKEVIHELTNYINKENPQETLHRYQPSKVENTSTLNNFSLITYSSRNITRRNSFGEKSKMSSNAVKRSVSHVSLAKIPKSPKKVEVQNMSPLRKTTSEMNINREEKPLTNGHVNVPGLQSLTVLKTILPHLSKSQGCVNKLGTSKECQKEEAPSVRPAVSLQTWGERPKRQVSIKSDRDYIYGPKLRAPPKPVLEEEKKENPPTQLISSSKVTRVEIKDVIPKGGPTIVNIGQNDAPRRTVSSVYSQLETGNTRPVSRVPVVRSVELKKPSGIDSLTRKFDPQPKGSYLFGCEPPPPPPAFPILKHVSPPSKKDMRSGRIDPRMNQMDPREQLLASIRDFGGKAKLRKVRS